MTPRHQTRVQETAGELWVSQREFRTARADAFQRSSRLNGDLVHGVKIASHGEKSTERNGGVSMRDEHYTLKAAFRRLVKAAGGVEAAEAVAGVSKASLSKWQSIDHDCFAPINVVLALESEVGTPVVTRELLRAQGYAAVPGEGQNPRDENLHTLLLGVTKELGEAVAAVGDMNHFPDLASFQPVEKEVFDVKKAADRLLDEVRRRRPNFCRELRKVS